MKTSVKFCTLMLIVLLSTSSQSNLEPSTAPTASVVVAGQVKNNAIISIAAFRSNEGIEGEVAVFSTDPNDSKTFRATVTCMLVEENRATIVAQIVESNVEDLVGKYISFWLVDNEQTDTYSSFGYYSSEPPCVFSPTVTVVFDGTISIRQ